MLIKLSTPGNHDAQGAACEACPGSCETARDDGTDGGQWRKRDGVEDRGHTFKPH